MDPRVLFSLQFGGVTGVFVEVLVAAAGGTAVGVGVVGAEFFGGVGVGGGCGGGVGAGAGAVGMGWAGWGGVGGVAVGGFGGFVPLGLFGVDVDVEPGVGLVGVREGWSGVGGVPFGILGVPLGFPAFGNPWWGRPRWWSEVAHGEMERGEILESREKIG